MFIANGLLLDYTQVTSVRDRKPSDKTTQKQRTYSLHVLVQFKELSRGIPPSNACALLSHQHFTSIKKNNKRQDHRACTKSRELGVVQCTCVQSERNCCSSNNSLSLGYVIVTILFMYVTLDMTGSHVCDELWGGRGQQTLKSGQHHFSRQLGKE